MKRFILVLSLSFLCGFCFSQTPVYSDQQPGWMKVYNYGAAPKPITVDHRTYSVKQLTIANQFLNWMQASYLPKGGLGDAKKMASDKLTEYNQQTKSLPQSYGAFSSTYITLKKNAEGKLVPADLTAWHWRIIANQTIGHNIELLSTPDQYYFYIQHYFNGAKADYKSFEFESNILGFNSHPALKKYIHFYQPKNGNLGTGLQYVVLLAKDNVMPFTKVTIGEFIKKTEERVPQWYAEEQHKNKTQRGFDAARIAQENRWLKEKYERAVVNVAKLKEKYKNRMNEIAEVRPGNNGLQDLTSSIAVDNTSWDYFDNRGLQSFPVYKHDAATAALCKTDQPQWIVVSWSAEGVLNGNPAGVHLHESILNNFNFDYLYNYFFAPEKVKGIPYKPLRMPGVEVPVTAQPKSSTAKENENNASVFFFDDFSTTTAGNTITGWNSSYDNKAAKATIEKVAGQKENWAVIKGHTLVPLNLKKPLPQDFELSFDLAVPKDIAWGTKAFEFFLGTTGNYNESTPFLKIRIKAGFSGRPGETSIESKFGNGYFENKKPYYEATGFSNDKDFNRVTIVLKKRGEAIEYLINNVKIAEITKAIPLSTVFNFIQLSQLNSDNDNQKYYISNFKITRL